MHRILLALLIGFLASNLSYAGKDKKPRSCAAGKACVCDGVGACTRSCEGEGCNFECRGPGACSFSCNKGKCNATNTGAGAMSFSCVGGGCTMTCSGSGACAMHSCKFCNKQCTGPGTCTSD